MKQSKRHRKLLSEVQRVLKTVKDREVISDLKEVQIAFTDVDGEGVVCLLYTSPSPRDP